MSNKRFQIWLPFIILSTMAAGIYVGAYTSRAKTSGWSLGVKSPSGKSKITDIYQYILSEYVDTLDPSKFQDDMVLSMLQNLDPHSSYIPASDLAHVSEGLEGNFDGIGIEFSIQKDTVFIVSVIAGGPSESVGVQSGGRIVLVDGESIAGIGIRNEQVMKKLRGPKGSQVEVGVLYRGKTQPVKFNITRGQIPIYSMEAAFMLDDRTGYMKISRFSSTTYQEFKKAFERLSNEGMGQLILDLRDNPGGYLEQAVELADEFLKNGEMIVYTEGKARKRRDYKASSKGRFEKGALAVLIDEGSASASEIIAGAIQDNDRGVIVGRRSFGKGLVQEEIRLNDGSAMRLTTARYYTPAGRCIQKPYDKGLETYQNELLERFTHGELYTADSTQVKDSTAYYTAGGRIVYGGGGIMPDVFVPVDTARFGGAFAKLASRGLLNRFTFDYADQNRASLMKKHPTATDFVKNFDREALFTAFTRFATNEKANVDMADMQKSKQAIVQQLSAQLARNLYGAEAYYRVQNQWDETIQTALRQFKENRLAYGRMAPQP